jgi:hypothetical protein
MGTGYSRERTISLDLRHFLDVLTLLGQFFKAISCIRILGNEIARSYPELYKPNILIETYRIAHNQFPWQRGITRDATLRYFRIFGTTEFEPILRTSIGLSASELYTIGMALSGHFSEQFVLNLPAQVKDLQVTVEQIDQFVMLFSADVPTLRADAAKNQSYDPRLWICVQSSSKIPFGSHPRGRRYDFSSRPPADSVDATLYGGGVL